MKVILLEHLPKERILFHLHSLLATAPLRSWGVHLASNLAAVIKHCKSDLIVSIEIPAAFPRWERRNGLQWRTPFEVVRVICALFLRRSTMRCRDLYSRSEQKVQALLKIAHVHLNWNGVQLAVLASLVQKALTTTEPSFHEADFVQIRAQLLDRSRS